MDRIKEVRLPHLHLPPLAPARRHAIHSRLLPAATQSINSPISTSTAAVVFKILRTVVLPSTLPDLNHPGISYSSSILNSATTHHGDRIR